jgi:hypothetical protein
MARSAGDLEKLLPALDALLAPGRDDPGVVNILLCRAFPAPHNQGQENP